MSQTNEQLIKLTEIVQAAIQRDMELRQRYEIGEKFKFIRERLNTLLTEVQQTSQDRKIKEKALEAVTVEADEALVFVHLYNAQGLSIKTWESIITPKAFFDFSVNRPIYKEKAEIQSFIDAKPNRAQHGYLTVAVKQERILSPDNLKDAMGHMLVKVKEGSLRRERLVSFTHNQNEYILNEEGDLIKK
jgi:hypothetical protein